VIKVAVGMPATQHPPHRSGHGMEDVVTL